MQSDFLGKPLYVDDFVIVQYSSPGSPLRIAKIARIRHNNIAVLIQNSKGEFTLSHYRNPKDVIKITSEEALAKMLLM